MKQINLFILLLVISLSTQAQGYQIDTLHIASKILQENRTILIFQPHDANPSDSVDILYMLDGEWAESRYTFLLDEQPEQKIVGIAIVNTNRNRDMLPQKDPAKFLEFIEKELITVVEEKERINERILFGHSFAGGFTINSMLSKPGLFDKYIASSPTPIMDFVNPLLYLQLDDVLVEETKFYFSYGSRDMRQVKKWTERLSFKLSVVELQMITWKNEILEGKNHSNSASISLVKGMKL